MKFKSKFKSDIKHYSLYVRQDLAARNVLLTQEEVCKIADFGLSRKLGDDDDIYVSRVSTIPRQTLVRAIARATVPFQTDY